MNINGLLIFIKFVVFGSINFDNGTLLLSHRTQLLRLGLVLTFHFVLSLTEIKIVTAQPTFNLDKTEENITQVCFNSR